MVIVAGYLMVDEHAREEYLHGCHGVVVQARGADGCLDFAISPDVVDPCRINIFEPWTSRAAVDDFRGSGVGADQASAITSASVAEYDTAEVRELS